MFIQNAERVCCQLSWAHYSDFFVVILHLQEQRAQDEKEKEKDSQKNET